MVARAPGEGSKTTSPAFSDSPPMDRQAIRRPGSSFRTLEFHSMAFSLSLFRDRITQWEFSFGPNLGVVHARAMEEVRICGSRPESGNRDLSIA